MSGPASNSVAGTMESGFDPATGLVARNDGRYGANAWPSNPMSKTGMFAKVQNSPNAANRSMNNPWPVVRESNFAGSWLK
jgi:hypothetical protein